MPQKWEGRRTLPAGVAAQVHGRTAGGDDGAGAAAAAAASPGNVVGVVGAAIDQVIGLAGQGSVQGC